MQRHERTEWESGLPVLYVWEDGKTEGLALPVKPFRVRFMTQLGTFGIEIVETGAYREHVAHFVLGHDATRALAALLEEGSAPCGTKDEANVEAKHEDD